MTSRSFIIVFLVALAAVLGVSAHGTHPVSDNMCGSHNYGDCYNQQMWERGWYDFLRHSGSSEFSDSVRDSNGNLIPGATSYGGQLPRVPDNANRSGPSTPGTCYVQRVTVDGVDYQRCVSREEFTAARQETCRQYWTRYVEENNLSSSERWRILNNLTCADGS